MQRCNAGRGAGDVGVMRRPSTKEPSQLSGDAEARFAQLYAEFGVDVMAYASRRAPGPEDAADVVAETFLVAWRRAGDVPPGPDARLWLYGIARHKLANQQRGERRRARLVERLRVEASTRTPSGWAPEPECRVLGALRQMDEQDREVLLLAGWEELAPTEIARVLGISAVAARSRLHRARRRLRKRLAEAQVPSSTPYGITLEMEDA